MIDLGSSGLRPTKQRLDNICKVLFDRKETFHFTIDNLKKKIEKNTKSKISLATVYNTVHAFKNNGYLKEISYKVTKLFLTLIQKAITIFMIKIQVT